MWNFQEHKEGRNYYFYTLQKDGQNITVQAFFEYLSTSTEFILFFNKILENHYFEAYSWECISLNNPTKVYEFALVKNNLLAQKRPNYQPFYTYFSKTEKIVSFENLGKNAELVVPCPVDEYEFTHLAKFVRSGLTDHIITLWKEVGKIGLLKLQSEKKYWLSTAGLGVSWLHIRFDTMPKYYKTQKYK